MGGIAREWMEHIKSLYCVYYPSHQFIRCVYCQITPHPIVVMKTVVELFLKWAGGEAVKIKIKKCIEINCHNYLSKTHQNAKYPYYYSICSHYVFYHRPFFYTSLIVHLSMDMGTVLELLGENGGNNQNLVQFLRRASAVIFIILFIFFINTFSS